MTLLFQHLHTGIQDGFISAEFVDDKPFDHFSFFRLQKLYRTVKLGKHSASVNISYQKNRSAGHFCHTHIYDILCFQVDLCRTSGSFNHNNIVFGCQCMVGFHHIRH